MLDIPSQYMHYCLVLLCYCVRNRDHCCVLCDVARDLLLSWYIVHQPNSDAILDSCNVFRGWGMGEWRGYQVTLVNLV